MATPIPQNEARFSLKELLTATGGALRGPLEDAALEVLGISTDSRTIRKGEAFVALRGERFDGHAHLQAVAERGASVAIVETDARVAGLTTLRVESTTEALGRIGAFHLERWRKKSGGRVVAITGSAGKTTTKRALAALLETRAPGRVLSTPGNLNNLVGVPMTLLTLIDSTEFCVLELGTNAPGEIGKLARIARPDVAVLTLIASAHSEGLGGIDAIEREKCAIFEALRPWGVAVGNLDDERVARGLARSGASRALGYGAGPAAEYRLLARRPLGASRASLEIRRRDDSRIEAATPLIGEAGALAVLAALAAVEALLPDDPFASTELHRALAAIADETPGPGRMQPRELAGDVILLDDSYNANPASSRSSIASATELASSLGRPLVLILGEMRELGHDRLEAHSTLGEQAAASGARVLVSVGDLALHAAERARELGLETHHARDSGEAAELACELVRAGDVVLVKGSRGVRTEVVVDALVTRASRGDAGQVGGHT